jgi:hypothetical protein
VFRKYGSDEGECARKYKPRRHSSVHEQVSLLIIKIVVMCRNIQRQGYVVFGEFFHLETMSPTTSQKHRMTHLRVCRLQKKNLIYY